MVDYLLKAIEFGRFLKAVNNLKFIASEHSVAAPIFLPGGKDHLFVNSDKKRIKIYFKEIVYIESLKEYINVVTHDKSITTKFQLGQIEEYLSKTDFLRIHRSFIVSKEKIDAIYKYYQKSPENRCL